MVAAVEEAVSYLPVHLSIRSKIIAGFTAVLICTIGLGLFSTQRLDAVNGSAQDIKDNYLPGTRILGRMAQVSERLRSNRGSLLLATTEAQRAQYGATIKEQAALYARAGRISAARLAGR
jgi:methyl-accepting chemotaxis protein